MIKTDYSFKPDFVYKHDNPYHDKLEELYSDFVYCDTKAEEFRGKWNLEIFKRPAPLYLEIGTGAGHFMMDYCQANPGHNFVGLDYRFKRSYYLAKKLNQLKEGNLNFRYLRAKGERVSFLFEKNELDGVFYFFPDPWPKTKHHKKRLIQKGFLEALHGVLKLDGKFFIKTDHDDYAHWMKREIEACGFFDIEMESKDLYSEFPDHFLCQQQTGFEKIFLKQNIKIKAFVLTPRRINV